jgi:hypothetical protein
MRSTKTWTIRYERAHALAPHYLIGCPTPLPLAPVRPQVTATTPLRRSGRYLSRSGATPITLFLFCVFGFPVPVSGYYYGAFDYGGSYTYRSYYDSEPPSPPSPPSPPPSAPPPPLSPGGCDGDFFFDTPKVQICTTIYGDLRVRCDRLPFGRSLDRPAGHASRAQLRPLSFVHHLPLPFLNLQINAGEGTLSFPNLVNITGSLAVSLPFARRTFQPRPAPHAHSLACATGAPRAACQEFGR